MHFVAIDVVLCNTLLNKLSSPCLLGSAEAPCELHSGLKLTLWETGAKLWDGKRFLGDASARSRYGCLSRGFPSFCEYYFTEVAQGLACH